MKYLKISLPKQQGGNLIYPDRYQSEIGDYAQDHLYFDDTNGTNLLLLITDKDYKETMIRDRVEEITETDAKTISESNENRTEIIVDEAKVRRLEIKSRLGMSLTTEEMDAIDPTIPGGVFETSKILSDRIDEKKAVEVAIKETKTIG
jgi:hypothetical protein